MNIDNIRDFTGIMMLSMTLLRESRGQTYEEKVAVAWSIKNRVLSPLKAWWGSDWDEVMLKPWQYTGMTGKGDPNLVVWPKDEDPAWIDCVSVACQVYFDKLGDSDPTLGATHYYDKSLDKNPPAWSKSPGAILTRTIGKFRFFKGVK